MAQRLIKIVVLYILREKKIKCTKHFRLSGSFHCLMAFNEKAVKAKARNLFFFGGGTVLLTMLQLDHLTKDSIWKRANIS